MLLSVKKDDYFHNTEDFSANKSRRREKLKRFLFHLKSVNNSSTQRNKEATQEIRNIFRPKKLCQ